MKKIILPVMLCAIFILAASCGKAPSESADSPASNESTAGTETALEDETPKKDDIFGSIKEIVGNLATIELAVMPEDGIPVPGARRISNIDPENLPEGFEISTNEDGSFNMPEGVQGGFIMNGDGTPPEGAEGRTMRGGDGSEGPNTVGGGPVTRNEDGSFTLADGSTISADDMPARGQFGGLNAAFLDYTGDEIEFILPIGVPIYAVTNDEDGNQIETEIDLNDVANNNVINVTYKPDGKTIDKILVSQVTASTRPEGMEMPEGWTRPDGSEINTEDNGGVSDE